jgi:hypothetical protein
MNKKEQAQVEAMKTKLMRLAAFRMTSPVERDLDPPAAFSGEIVNGWDYNVYWGVVLKACSSSIHHSLGNWDKTTSQNSRRLFSTKMLALKALRYETEQQCMTKLAAIDRAIEQEEQECDQ